MSVMRRYYAPGVALFVGCAVTGVLWFDRPSGSVTGEDVAELHAAAWERAVVPGLLGESVPDTGYDTVVTNAVTNFVVEVELEHVGGYSAYSASPRILYFHTTNWAVPQAVTVTPAGRPPDGVPVTEGEERVRVRYSEGPSSSIIVGEYMAVLVYPAGYSPSNTAASSRSGHGVTVTPSLLGVGDSPGYGMFTVTLSSPPAHRVDSVEVVGIRTNRTALYNVGPYYYTGVGGLPGSGSYVLGSGFYDAADAARRLLSYPNLRHSYKVDSRWVRSSDVDGWGSQEWTADYGTAPLTVTPDGSPRYAGGSLSEIFAPFSYSWFDTVDAIVWEDWGGWCSDVFTYLSATSSVDAAFTPRETSTVSFGWATEDSLFLPADGLWCAAFGPEEYRLGWYGDVYGFRTNRGVFAGGAYVYGPHVRDFFGYWPESLSDHGTNLVAADPGVYAGGSLWAAAGYSATNLYQWDGFERLGTNSYGERAAIPKRYPGTNEASRVRDLLSRLDCSYQVSAPVLRGYTVVRSRDEKAGTVSRVTNDTVGAYWKFEGIMSRLDATTTSYVSHYSYHDPPDTMEPVTLEETNYYTYERHETNYWESTAETGFVTNIVLTWPSRYAVESGYVSRVRVYGIFRQYEWNGALAPGSGGSTNFFSWEPGPYVDYTRSAEYSWTHYRGDPPSCVLDACYGRLATGAPLFGFPAGFRLSHDVPPSGVTYDAAARVHGGGAYVPAVASVIRPVLLDGDVDLSSWPLLATSPVPSYAASAYEWVPAGGFDTVTLDGAYTSVGSPHHIQVEPDGSWWAQGYSDWGWTGSLVGQYYAYRFSLVLEEIITVVDWNWKHLSDSAAAESGFVPEWVESNTDSPLAP